MAVKKIRKIGDPVLREKSNKVEKIDDKVISLVNDMIDIAKEEGGVGLAAPQIGVSRRVIIVDRGDGTEAFINPEIKVLDKEMESSIEGCLSIYSIRDYSVNRYKKVEVKAKDLKGRDVVVKAEGLLARIFQHEIDHLNGKMYIDHLDRKSREELLSRVNEIKMGI
ncbi:MAG: peptide deformylase [Actinomycetota bacterium]|nr:peptide deformylase [Actinomycetota bacterium]